MNKYIIFYTVIAMTGDYVFADTLPSLNKENVLQLIEGNTISTDDGTFLEQKETDNQFMAYFDKNGTSEGWFSKSPHNQPQKDAGTWMVKEDGSFCITWDHWTAKKPNCVSIYKVRNGYIFINQKMKQFENMVFNTNIKSGKPMDNTPK